MMTTCLDLAAELLSALIAGHEERVEVREERRGAGGHVCQGLRRIGARDALTLATLVTRNYSSRAVNFCSRHRKMSLFREGGGGFLKDEKWHVACWA